MNESLGNALESAEITTDAPGPAQAELETPVNDQSATDSSLQKLDESVEAKPEEAKLEGDQSKEGEQPSNAQLDFKALREQKTTLETELSGIRENLNKFGGESNLQIMAPMLQKAAEIPLNGDTEKWSGEMWQAVSQSFVPAQVNALRSQAAWDYLTDPTSAATIVQDLYGDKMTPELLKEFAAAYERDPSITDVFRPDETAETRAVRERYETEAQAREAKDKERDEQLQRIEDERHEGVFKQTMTQALQVGLAPRAEVKKQFGLEFQKSDQDTAEMSAFKEFASEIYDELVTLRLSNDAEMNRLSDAAQSWANQRDEMRNGQRVDRSAQRQKAVTDFAPLIQQKSREICAKVATRLSKMQSLLSPELSDQAKANNLRDLKPNVLGGDTGAAGSAGIDFSSMPDANSDPRGYATWVAKMFVAQNAEARTPPILQAG